jgi:hypothetical protein
MPSPQVGRQSPFIFIFPKEESHLKQYFSSLILHSKHASSLQSLMH